MATMPRTRKAQQAAPTVPLIGDESTGGFVSCPKCGRPVADGLVRCAGCGTRVLMGVAAPRALLFMTTGAVLGLLVGGLSVGWIMNTSRAVSATASAAALQANPSPGHSPAPSATARVSTVDPLAASALRQVASTNSQLATSVDALRHELRARPFDTGAIAGTLRTMSAAATYGTSVLGYLGAWPDAAALQGQMGSLYTHVRAVAANGLAANMASTAAYQAAANQMISVLAALPAVRAAAADLAQAGGVDLPGGAPSPAASN